MSGQMVEERGLHIDFADPAFIAAPWPALLRLQQEDPVHWSEAQNGWVVTRHDDVKAAFADRRLSSARGNQLFGGLSPDLTARLAATIKFNALNVNRLDGSDHIRIRTLVMKAFSNTAVRNLTPAIGDIVDTILGRLPMGEDFDFMAQVAAFVPPLVIQRMLGLPDHVGGMLFRLASDFTAATGAARMTTDLLLALDTSIATMNEVFNELIEERERAPGDDLISTLVHARDGLNRLSHDELLACFHSIIVAGVETTAHSLGTGLVELARRPALAARVAQGAEQAFAVVTEMLRYPGTVKCMTRIAAEDFDWHGRAIRKGDLVWVVIAAANVDPAVFDDAMTIDPDRDNRAAMSFAPGLHHCVGHQLTRIELSEVFSRIFSRFEVTLAPGVLEFVPSYIFRGYRALPVRLDPR